MILDPETLSANTLVSVGSAVVVMGAAIKGTMVLTNIHRDLSEMKTSMVRRSEVDLWIARLARDNPSLKIEDLAPTKDAP